MKLSTIELIGNVIIDRRIVLSGNLMSQRRLLLEGDVRISASGGGTYPVYPGPYNVVPQTYAQQLHTDNMLMKDDVNVEEIPYAEVSNVFGKTAVIAS